LAATIATQRLETIARRIAQIVEIGSRIDQGQLHRGGGLDVGREAARPAIDPKPFRLAIAKTHDHREIITHNVMRSNSAPLLTCRRPAPNPFRIWHVLAMVAAAFKRFNRQKRRGYA